MDSSYQGHTVYVCTLSKSSNISEQCGHNEGTASISLILSYRCQSVSRLRVESVSFLFLLVLALCDHIEHSIQ